MSTRTTDDNNQPSNVDCRVRQLEDEMASLKSSLSWRVTKPLRYVRDSLEVLVRPFWQRAVVALQKRAALKEQLGSFLPSAPGTTKFDFSSLDFPQGEKKLGNAPRLTSMLCERAYMESPAGRYWTSAMDQPWRLHRKLWEFCFISQALYERGVLGEGKKGLGFAVGEEPLPALFASMGCEILATDLDAQDERATAWAETAQLATSVDKLRRPRVCPNDIFQQRVAFRAVDMNNIPKDLRDFDFTWSSCSFEHCAQSTSESTSFAIRWPVCDPAEWLCIPPNSIFLQTTIPFPAAPPSSFANRMSMRWFIVCSRRGTVLRLWCIAWASRTRTGISIRFRMRRRRT